MLNIPSYYPFIEPPGFLDIFYIFGGVLDISALPFHLQMSNEVRDQ